MPGLGRSDQSCIVRQSWLSKPVVVRKESTVKRLPQIACTAASEVVLPVDLGRADEAAQEEHGGDAEDRDQHQLDLRVGEPRPDAPPRAARRSRGCETAGSRKSAMAISPSRARPRCRRGRRPARCRWSRASPSRGRPRRRAGRRRGRGAGRAPPSARHRSARCAAAPAARRWLASSIVPLRPRSRRSRRRGRSRSRRGSAARGSRRRSTSTMSPPIQPTSARQRCSGSAASCGRSKRVAPVVVRQESISK